MPVTRIKNNVVTDSNITPSKLAVTTAMQTFLGNATSANLAAAVSGTTGTGNLVFANNATFSNGSVTGDFNITGNVGIGTASPQVRFHVNDGISRFERGGVQLNITPNWAGLGNLVFDVVSNSGMMLRTNNTDRLLITATGIISIGNSSPNTSAQFQVDSTTRGFLPPRMTISQRNAIATPAAGLTVYTTDGFNMSYHNGTSWGDVFSSHPASFTSATLAAAVSDETGSGSLVFNTNPTFQDANVNGNTFTTRLGVNRTTLPSGVSLGVGPNIINDSNLPVQYSSSTAINYIGLNAQAIGSYGGLIGYTETEFGGGLILRTVPSRPINFITDNTSIRMIVMPVTGNVGIGTTTPSERLTVSGNVSVTGNISASGHFSAATKSFKIPHQTKEGYLQYGVVESNEHSVYVRGKTDSNIIELPEHWEWLVDGDSVTVQLTPIGAFQPLFVESCDNKKVTVGGNQGIYSYVVYGTRKDVAPLEIEIA